MRGVGLRVLFPPDAPSAEEVLRTVRPPSLPAGRPYVIANFVSTVDGAVTLEGASGAINRHAPGDAAVFHALREQVDAVLAGTGTLAKEQYGRLVPSTEGRARRAAAGLEPDPIAVVLSRSGNIPDGIPLLDDERQPRRILTGGAADPVAAFAALREQDGVEVLLCEGGPTLLGELVRLALVDELWLTLSPVLAGGTPERTLLGGQAAHARPLKLRSLLELDGGLHARYAMLGAEDPSGLSSEDPSASPPTPGAHPSQ